MENINGTFESEWTSAARDGVFLALVTVISQTINVWFPSPVVGMLLWAVKFGGSIWLLSRFMKRFAASGAGGSVTGYGIRVCLFSSIICAAWTFAMYGYLFPDLVTKAFEQIPAMLEGAQLPDEAQDMLLNLEDNFAQYSFTATLIWDIICGLIFSVVLSGPIARDAMFPDKEDGSDDDELL